MYLEDVTIEGFKSFSEASLMSFQPGIGVIIGSNGVGKSNILDAIAWGLGENDLSNLRCHAEEELFFCGSSDFPAADHAQVELNFKGNGSDGWGDLKVIRKRTRKGEDLYRVGGQELSAESYAQNLAHRQIPQALVTIIRQEHINDLVSLSPRDRFAWIQRALGMPDPADAEDCLRDKIEPLFHRYLTYLFPEGESRVDVIHHRDGPPGLEIEVTLSGNRRRKVHQLSGGEKSATSLALKLALFQQLESPFYMMDEVEPALDYTNHKAMQELLRDLAKERQIIMITHLRSTIELADTVHGTRSRKDGSSFMKFHFVMDERLLRLFAGR